MRTIDTNILVYRLTGRNGDLSRRWSQLLYRERTGQKRVYLPPTAVFECIYICQGAFDIPNSPPASLLLEVLAFPGIVTDRADALIAAIAFWCEQGPLSFADCHHLALTKTLGMDAIYTFDRKMDRYPGVKRAEPG